MPHRPALLGAALLLVVACSSSPEVRECSDDADCGVGNVCHRGSCAANAAPTASFTAPASATTHRLTTIVPTVSDPEGHPVDVRWTVSAVDATCEAEPEPHAGPELGVVFWCPGTYEVVAVPVDDLGLEGAPVAHPVEVAAATGAPSVAGGPAVAATHRCNPATPACHVEGADGSSSLELGATGSDPDGAPLEYRWLAIPPEAAAADPALQVSLAGADLPSPTAFIANGGGPIAGVYRFRVRVRNPAGLLGQAFQDVVVANAPPTAALGSTLLPHRFVDAQFVAEGDVETGALDADGDPIVVSGSLSPLPPSGCVEAVTPGPGLALHVRIACAVAAGLVGATPRTLTVTVTDANGGEVGLSAPLPIENRPPQLLLDAAAFPDDLLAVDHRVEPCRLADGSACFVADGADPFVAVDPDGDPLDAYLFGATVAPARSRSRGITSIEGTGRRFRFETPTTLPLEFRAPDGTGGFALGASIRDAFGATATATRPLAVRNRAPVVAEAVAAVDASHVYDASQRRYAATASGPRFEDPDGDPILPSVAGSVHCTSVTADAGRAVVGCTLPWDYTLGTRPPLQAFLGAKSVAVSASDGWATASSPMTISILDSPATVSAPIPTVEHCACVYGGGQCSAWQVGRQGIPLPVQLSDPDGDPAQIVAVGDNFTSTPVTCLPGWCYPAVDADIWWHIAAGTVTADTGSSAAPAQASYSVTPTCATEGFCCTP